MKLKPWLDIERGRYTALAAHLNVTVSRISQMASDGVPVKFMHSVAEFTGGQVSITDMVEARTPSVAHACNVPAQASA